MTSRSEKEKMLAGELYRAVGAELESDQRRAQGLLHAYNLSSPDEKARRTMILHELLGSLDDEVVIRTPFHCDYGYNIRVGRSVFVNFGCVFLDVVTIEIGEYCQIGPAVQIYTATHPHDPALRRAGYESGKPVRIGRNVWIGGGAIVLPGVTIGDDAVIGAGSVVTRDVAAGTTVVGNPARSQDQGREPSRPSLT